MARQITAVGVVETSFWAKPIPTRDHDWQATHEDYDPESRLYGHVGHGATEAAAVADLLEQMES